MTTKNFELTITTPDGTFLKESAVSFLVRAYGGYIGILPEHTPFISTVKPCKFEVKQSDSAKPLVGFVADGILSVEKKATKVIATKVIWLTDVKKEEIKDNLTSVEEQLKTETKSTKVKSLKTLKEYYELILKESN